MGATLCALTMLGWWAWTFSPEGWFPRPHYYGSRWGFAVGRAYLTFRCVTIEPPPGRTMRDFTRTEEAGVAGFISSPAVDDIIPGYDSWDYAGWLPTLHTYLGGSQHYFNIMQYRFYVPLITLPLLIFIPAGVATGLLWYLDRRRSQPGHCEDCGYDLTGNVSGRCPECGAAIVQPAEVVHQESAS